MRRHQARFRSEPEDGIIGKSRPVQELRRLILRVAPTEATVLIQGERGTGKELVARAVHAASRRQARPFIPVNCAALPSDLLAAELFGHERGAFTGAVDRRPGVLVAAAGGTVFLDEIGDLSLAGQAMLLRFLQEREVRALGSTETVRVDVRVIAATNKDLERGTRDGTFRADLHDRVSEVTLTVPPLRDRREDIALLVEHFLERHSRRHRVPVPDVTAGALRLLERSAWPGNVRGLEKAIGRAVVFAEDGWIRPGDLGLSTSGEREEALTGIAHARAVPGRSASAVRQGLTHRQQEVLHLAELHGVLRRRDVMAHLGISGETARRDLVALTRLGLLRRAGRRRGCRYVIE